MSGLRRTWLPLLAALLGLLAPAWAQGLPVPKGLTVQPASGADGQTTLVLQWDPVPGAYGYEVLLWQDGKWRLNEEDTNFIPVTASTRIGGLRPDTPYEFRVRATAGAANASDLSEAVGGRTVATGAVAPAEVPRAEGATAAPPTLPTPGAAAAAAKPSASAATEVTGPAPETPTGVIGMFLGSESVQLVWRKVAGAAYYRVEEEKDGRWVELPGAEGQPHENRVVLLGHFVPGPYRFRVSSVGGNGRMSEPCYPISISRD